MLFAALLEKLIQRGRLTVIDAGGRCHRFGTDAAPAVTIRLHDRRLHWRLALRLRLALGEAYTDGTLSVADGTIYDFLDLIGRNVAEVGEHRALGLLDRADRVLCRLRRHNPLARAHRNAAYHYDLPAALFDLFLDEDRQYSCAYFQSPDDDLDLAQRQKRRLVASKLLLRPGMTVLDIGCGWGGLDLYLASHFDARVTGITLSAEQLALARRRAAAAGLDGRVAFLLRDYRDEREVYDRIVSVGMFEHVGAGDYDAFFACLRERLADDGVALVHTIGRAEPPGAGSNPWIRRYIFPGGYLPALSEVAAAIERQGLFITDVEVLRLHYALTLRHWRQRFLAQWPRAQAQFGDRFCRMWEFFLAASEISFRYLRCVVFQIQLARRQDAVPLVRDYLWHAAPFAAGEAPARPSRVA
jgi:cyclopropane-fatty-acyl-phospholipid synthase